MIARPASAARKGRRLLLALALLAVLVAVIWMVLTIGSPFPPRTVVMATGPAGSGYGEDGVRYQEILRRSGVNLQLVQTKGGVENLAQLRDSRSGVSVAFVESGITNRQESPDLLSLGAIAVEPLWMFFRDQPEGNGSRKLVGKRLSIEPEGSATQVLVRRMLALNGLDETQLVLLDLTPERAAEALLHGEIDGVMMLTSWHSPTVQRLLAADGIVLEGFPRADAYVARFPSLSKVVLPTGVADFAKNIPSTDISLLAVESNLVVRKGLHPATQYLLLEAASEVHGGPGIFHRAGRFPAPEAINLPLSEQASTFYKSGRPFMYRYLPLWLAGLAERLLVVLIPLFAIVFPLVNFVPTVIRYVTERRVFALYGELRIAESQLEGQGPIAAIDDIAASLQDLAIRANRLKVPLGYAQRLFILKNHIALAQQEIERRRGVTPNETT
jgi:TRAP-type uncharacterized transport system substrate-binding protein